MKRLIIPSILFLSYAVAMCAQDKPRFQITAPEKLLLFPPQPVSPSVSGIVQGLDLHKDFRKLQPIQTHAIELKGFYSAESEVCSVPLIEVHVDAIDPGVAVMPRNNAVAIPQAHVPAPACEKK
jgi:hypothetical protein